MKNNAWFKVCYLNGSPDGIVKCAFDKVGVIGYRIPRLHIPKIKELDGASEHDFKNPGVYVLAGEPSGGKMPVYVGQAAPRKGVDPFYSRLSEHDKLEKRTREWWTTAYVFMDVARDSLRINETGLKYLENALHVMLSANETFDVRNGNEPPSGSPDESMQSVLDNFLDGIVLSASVLGLRVDEIGPENHADAVLQRGRSFHGSTIWGEASMLWAGDNKFVVLAGSAIRTEPEAKSLCSSSLKQRKMLAKAYMPDGELKENVTFTSASAAAGFVAGTPVNGLTFWRNEKGENLKSVLGK